MQFRLLYEGLLRSGNSKDREHVHNIRRAIHSQLKVFWQAHPVLSFIESESGPTWHLLREKMRHVVDGREYRPLIGPHFGVGATIDILFLRPSPPGALLKNGGDLDNRIKTLIDGLRVPAAKEVPDSTRHESDETPLHCLLSDDKLVTAFSVTSDQLFERDRPELYVRCLIHVKLVGINPTALATNLLY